jgi:hypothetical protein
MGLSDLTLQVIVFRVLALLIIVGIHGSLIAWTAALLGDQGPRQDGRLTINPGSHVDLLGGASLILFGLGWSKPVAVEARNLRFGGAGLLVVILAGFFGLIATAIALAALIQPALTSLPLTSGLATAAFLRAASGLALSCAFLSLLPLPPLAGGLLLGAFAGSDRPWLKWVSAAVVIVLMATGVMRQMLDPVAAVLTPFILHG